jgi:tetratricopeptide (TPR) repeat protein
VALRPPRLAAAVVFVLLSGVGFVPLFGGPGYEHALASGLIVPSAAAISVALQLLSGPAPVPLACAGRGLATGVTLALVAYATALLHGLRVGMCDFAGGSVLFALTAGCGALLGGIWGACVAEVARGRKRPDGTSPASPGRGRNPRIACVLLGLAAPLAGVVASVARFYGSPMVFSYDPFFGYFSGTLYDTIVDVRTELWTYRAGTAATLAGAVLVASALGRTASGGIARPRGTGAFARLLAGVVCLFASFWVAVEGPALGHWQTATTIARALGGHASGPRCDVYYPDSVLAREAELLLRDCEQELAADEQKLGTHLEGRLTAFVFRDPGEKRRLMGAAETSIAKPWRREVYVQLAGFPHPILGHEIAHVVAGSFGRGPFRIAGSFGGLLPDPGLIEGVAVATSPDDDELTDAQWARAMLDLGILPRMTQLFSLGFLGENASKSYTAAGAFVAWVSDRWGSQVVRSWYGGGSLEALTGEGWGALERDFRAYLASLAMPSEASAYAKARFERPSVWARHCPHVVDALDRDGDRCRDDRRYEPAIAIYDEAIRRDPHDWHALYARARVRTWFVDEARGRKELEGLTTSDAPRTWRDRAREALADDDLARGRPQEAAQAYRALAASALDEDVARTLEVKALAASDPRAREAIVDLLLGEPGRPVDAGQGALSLGAWAGATHEPLPGYLVGKNYALREDHARAAVWLDGALASGVPTPRIERELLRERALAACALGDARALDRVERAVLAPGSAFEPGVSGRREWLLRLIARCRKA